MRETRISGWEELNRELYCDSWNADLRRFRANFAYRGMGDAAEDLTSGLMRLGGNYRELEAHLLRNFKKYAAQGASWSASEWNWLALAQHHGLPTRLLDWTYSPLVAAHFATAAVECFDRDGVIWAADYVGIHRLLPPRLRRILNRERSNAFTVEMLAEAAPDLRSMEKLSAGDFALFVEPPSLDARIVNQFALFSMTSSPSTRLDEWLEKQKAQLARRIIVPAGVKWEIRDKLDQANITERVLLPGLDGLAQWLRRHYLPRAQPRR
ncbi:MAG TPA: FRG domain-containing protein [Terriglobales bacterium]|jgi:FRG domain